MKRLIDILIITPLFFCACTSETIEELHPGKDDANKLTLTYTIPDATVGSSTSTRAGDGSYVEATLEENTVDGLHLFFFESDAHGNGKFIASATATLEDANLKNNTITLTLPPQLDNKKDYSVLVIANLAKYFTKQADLDIYLASFNNKNYGQAWEELQVLLPNSFGVYSFPNQGLPMSGTTVKRAGNTAISVNLLRAVVRIDVKLNDQLKNVTLDKVQLRNVATIVPLFRTQEQVSIPRAMSTEFDVNNNRVNSQLYAVETSLDVNDSHVLLNDATCLLLSIKSTNVHTGSNADKTWYRVNLNIKDKMQLLKRNNAYCVVVNSVQSAGATTADDAYNDKVHISAVTIPTEWKTSGVNPPEVVIQ